MGVTGAINLFIIVVILLGVLTFLAVRLSKKPNLQPKKKHLNNEKYSEDFLLEFVKESINRFVNVNLLDLGLNEEEYKRREGIVNELRAALKGASTGDIKEKVYLKNFIYDLINRNYGIDDQTINLIIPFNDQNLLTIQDKFDIVLYKYKKKYGFKALEQLIEKYSLDQPKREIEDGTVESLMITDADIERIYPRENINLSYSEKLEIVVQRIYQQYKGYGVIDEIRDMSIDGLSGGVNGIPPSMQVIDDEMTLFQTAKKQASANYDSVWIFYKGKSMRLAFLSFGSELELKRVCQNIYKYNNPGQLTESNGYKINEMKDGSRVVVVRPPFAESWAFWVRKFDFPNFELDILISDESAENAELPREMIKFLMKGGRTTSITGNTGSGKTSLLAAAIKYIYAELNIRIQELMFEINMRRLYPDRNNLATRETDTISGQESLDLHKKTDTDVFILGEIASDEVASWAVKMGTIASKFLVFTAHPTNFENLIFYLRDALINMKYSTDQKIAEERVAKVIEMDIHMIKSMETGKRYIERITECVFKENDYNAIQHVLTLAKGNTIEDKLNALIALQVEDYRSKYERSWKGNNIIEYENGRYVAKHPISQERVKSMLKEMKPEDGEQFKLFLKKHWGHVNYGF